MTLIDREGRLAGRINVVDLLALLCVVAIVPAAYASLMLFRPAKPRIESVTHIDATIEMLRLRSGTLAAQKFKVRGSGFTPLLRASVADVPAPVLAFESPTSVDLFIGDDVPFGTHDLVLYDGVQEVARASRAVHVLPPPRAALRADVMLIGLTQAAAEALAVGARFDVEGRPVAEVVSVGAAMPEQKPVGPQNGQVDARVEGQWQRAAQVRVYCAPDVVSAVCRIGPNVLGDPNVTTLNVPEARPPLRARLGALVPDTDPVSATLRLRIDAGSDAARLARAGDRDLHGGGVDNRAGVVSAVVPVGAAVDLVLTVGLDRSGDGWRYFGANAAPNERLVLITDRYAVIGGVIEVAIRGH
jgi:hypothetical protein